MSEPGEISDKPQIDEGKRKRMMLRRAAEEVFVDESVSGGFTESLNTALNKSETRRKRTAAAIKAVSTVLPDPVKDVFKEKLDFTQDTMPFDPRDYKLSGKLGYGAMNDVFLLESLTDGPSFVLKASIDSLGVEDSNDLVSIAAEQKRDYEFVAKKFEHISGLVSPEYFIVAQGPREGEPTVLTIQAFEGSNIRDIFKDFSPEELKDLVSRNDKLREQITQFVKTIDENEDLLENELDLLGERNLVVVGNEGEERLLLLDAHSRSPDARADYFKDEIANRVERLRKVVE